MNVMRELIETVQWGPFHETMLVFENYIIQVLACSSDEFYLDLEKRREYTMTGKRVVFEICGRPSSIYILHRI